jgi:hypothetical protein
MVKTKLSDGQKWTFIMLHLKDCSSHLIFGERAYENIIFLLCYLRNIKDLDFPLR